MQFEVNGQAFFVNFVPEEGRWYCYAPTEHGIQRIPVATDSAPFENFTFLDEPEQAKVVNRRQQAQCSHHSVSKHQRLHTVSKRSACTPF